jgi:E3 ubiquitin-protein ligase EDD1
MGNDDGHQSDNDDRQSEHSEHEQQPPEQDDVAESDMDLDLLAESESDSESMHSNQDNVSVQRSAVTMATAGSDAGKICIVVYARCYVVMFFICPKEFIC